MFGPMVLVALPEGVVSSHQQPPSYAHAEALQNTLYHQYSIEARVCVCACVCVCVHVCVFQIVHAGPGEGDTRPNVCEDL